MANYPKPFNVSVKTQATVTRAKPEEVKTGKTMDVGIFKTKVDSKAPKMDNTKIDPKGGNVSPKKATY